MDWDECFPDQGFAISDIIQLYQSKKFLVKKQAARMGTEGIDIDSLPKFQI